MDLHGDFYYPGITQFISATYTVGHGITPGCILVKTFPLETLPEPTGDAYFTDGETLVPIPDCKLERILMELDGDGGLIWSIEIADHRWKWRDFGIVNGCYNQFDPFGKLQPWTIRSPMELAEICLAKLGETDYSLAGLPIGLSYPGPAVQTPIINITGVNPPIVWDAERPGQALSGIADQFGARLVWQPQTGSVLLAKFGIGAPLPDGSIRKIGPSMQVPNTPDGVLVQGSPTRVQMQFGLVTVGEEWDGSVKPIDALSYAPRRQTRSRSSRSRSAARSTTHNTPLPSMESYLRSMRRSGRRMPTLPATRSFRFLGRTTRISKARFWLRSSPMS